VTEVEKAVIFVNGRAIIERQAPGGIEIASRPGA
jgi:hypothetical protein